MAAAGMIASGRASQSPSRACSDAVR